MVSPLSLQKFMREKTRYHAAWRFQAYIVAHTIKVIIEYRLRRIINRPDISGRLTKWALEFKWVWYQLHPSNNHQMGSDGSNYSTGVGLGVKVITQIKITDFKQCCGIRSCDPTLTDSQNIGSRFCYCQNWSSTGGTIIHGGIHDEITLDYPICIHTWKIKLQFKILEIKQDPRICLFICLKREWNNSNLNTMK